MMTENQFQVRSVDSLAQLRRSKSNNRSPRAVLPHRRMSSGDEDEPKRLDVVDLSGRFLDALPIPSVNLAAICKLDLSNNNLQVIQESVIARLVNVVSLDLHSNQLTALPNSIGCLSKLRVLNVSANLLRSLPKPIENCRCLEELNLNFNELTSLPETIGFELTNLTKLSINSNKISFLPYSTSHLTSLRILDVRLNSLRSLPDDLENLVNLQTLNLSQNFHHLTSLPSSIGLLLSLLHLDVSYNNISSLPTSLSCLHRLRTLSLEGNPLVSPPVDVVEMGLRSVKIYLTDRMNGEDSSTRKRSSSWFGKLRKYGTVNSRTMMGRRDEGDVRFKSNVIEAIASPRHYLSMLSPRRLFGSSSKDSFSRLS